MLLLPYEQCTDVCCIVVLPLPEAMCDDQPVTSDPGFLLSVGYGGIESTRLSAPLEGTNEKSIFF